MAKHPLLLEAIEKAKKAAYSTRGMYPITTAANVYMQDGTSLEEKVSNVETTTKEETNEEPTEE